MEDVFVRHYLRTIACCGYRTKFWYAMSVPMKQKLLVGEYYSQAYLQPTSHSYKGSEHARQSSPQKGQVRAHHSSTVRTSLAAGSAAYRLQNGHTHFQSETIRTSDLFFAKVIWLHSKPISPLCIPASSSDATYKNGSGTMRFYQCSSKKIWNSLPEYLRNCYILETFRRKLKTRLFNCAFLPMLVSLAPTNRLL